MTPDGCETGRVMDRRSVLRTAGATLAAGSVGLAGCTSTLPPLGQRVRFGRVDAPSRDPPVYGDWIPRREALQAEIGSVEPLQESMFVRPGDTGPEALGIGETIPEGVLRIWVDYFGVGFDSYDWVLTPGEGVVLAGRIDRDVVREMVTETVYEAVDTYRGFDHYRRTDEPAHLVVSDSHAVFDSGEHAWTNVRGIVDAGTGRATRYVDADATASEFVATVGSSIYTWYGVGNLFQNSPDEQDDGDPTPTGSAISFQIDDSAVYYVYESIYPAGQVPRKSVVEDWVEENMRAVEALGVEVSIDGRIATAVMRYPHATITEDDPTAFESPQVTWSSEYDPASETLSVTHHAGDGVDASLLGADVVDGSGTPELSPQAGQIGPGDTVTVDLPAAEATRVQLVLESRDGDRSAAVYSTDVPTG